MLYSGDFYHAEFCTLLVYWLYLLDIYIAVWVYCLSTLSWGIPILTVQECQSYSQFHNYYCSYRKFPKYSDTHESKRCRRNGDQCRPWSDWVCTVCRGLSVRKLRAITVPVTNLAARFCRLSSSSWRTTPGGSQTELPYSRTGCAWVLCKLPLLHFGDKNINSASGN